METRRKATMAFASLAAIWLLVVCGLMVEAMGRREFDYFALALQWPGTICGHTRHCCASNGCCRSEPLETFTIHGLWPDYDDGSWPSCCSHTNFDMEKILPLKPALEKYWPSLYCSRSSTCFSGKGPFWAHEWEKHGTCSFPVVQDEYQYFSTALDLYHKYDVMEMLRNEGISITNSKEYALRDVMDAIEHAFGASPQIVCKKGSVQELRLCFYKDFKPRDCVTSSETDGNVSRRKHCPRYITLPSYDPLVSSNTTGEIITRVYNDETLASIDAA